MREDHIAPPAAANTANICPIISVTPAGAGTFWVDDIQFIDDMTGENLFVDGGYEGDRIDYDSALAVEKYGVLLDGYGARASKPAVWGETGIRGPNDLGNPYKGYSYTNENQHLVDNTQGIHIKKMVWAHCGPANPNMLYWWTDNITQKGLWNYFKAFQAFMQGVHVSNGNYKDALATTSVTALRAWGQADLTNNCAHLWIDNTPYTWENVVNGVSVPAVTGTVTVPGLQDGNYKVEWWDTTAGTVTQTQQLTSTGGNLTLSVQNLQSDTACKIYPVQAKLNVTIGVPSTAVVPGQTITVTVQFTNSNDLAINNVSVTAQVPALMSYVPGSAEATGGSYNAATGVVSWTVDSVAANQSGTRSFLAIVQRN